MEYHSADMANLHGDGGGLSGWHLYGDTNIHTDRLINYNKFIHLSVTAMAGSSLLVCMP